MKLADLRCVTLAKERVEPNSILPAIPCIQTDARPNPSFVLFVFFVVKSCLPLKSGESQILNVKSQRRDVKT